jgi:septum site-determining protein MinC
MSTFVFFHVGADISQPTAMVASLRKHNPGAEIMADGHIHVYAPLRGKAIAGAKGDTTARIFTTSLEAELVSIAGVYRTSDTALPKEVLGKPAQVWLADEKLHMRGL